MFKELMNLNAMLKEQGLHLNEAIEQATRAQAGISVADSRHFADMLPPLYKAQAACADLRAAVLEMLSET